MRDARTCLNVDANDAPREESDRAERREMITTVKFSRDIMVRNLALGRSWETFFVFNKMEVQCVMHAGT